MGQDDGPINVGVDVFLWSTKSFITVNFHSEDQELWTIGINFIPWFMAWACFGNRKAKQNLCPGWGRDELQRKQKCHVFLGSDKEATESKWLGLMVISLKWKWKGWRLSACNIETHNYVPLWNAVLTKEFFYCGSKHIQNSFLSVLHNSRLIRTAGWQNPQAKQRLIRVGPWKPVISALHDVPKLWPPVLRPVKWVI